MRMKRPTENLLLLLALNYLQTLASTAFLSALKEDTLWKAKGIFDVFLAQPSFHRCSVILLTDGSTASSSHHFNQMLGSRGHKATLYEVMANEESDANLTQSRILQMVTQGRRLRLLSWCITLVVVSDDPYFLAAFAEASDSGRLMVWRTRLLVVTRMDMPRVQALLENYWTFSMMNTMFLILKKTSRIHSWQLFVHLPYTTSGAQVVRVASWISGRRLFFAEDRVLFPEKYSNFHGMQFNVTWLPLTPYFMERKQQGPDGKPTTTHRGREYLIMQTMGVALNFSVNPLPFEGWDTVLRRLKDREAFIWPVSLPVMPAMAEEYDFSFFLEQSPLAFTMAKPPLKPSWESIYYPLRIEVWSSVAVTVIIVFIFHLMMTHLDEGDDSGTWLVAKQVIGTLLDEAIPGELPRRDSARVMLTAWLIFAFIVGTVYRSNLTACLTVPNYPPRPETLTDLYESGARITITESMDIFVNSFKNSESDILRALAGRMEYVPSFKEGMTDSLTKNSAHLYERLYMEVKIEEYFTNNDGTTPLYVSKGSLWADYSAFLLIRDAPFKAKTDHLLMIFCESGLIEKWKTNVMNEIRRENRERRKNNRTEEKEQEEKKAENEIIPLTLTHMQGPLLLYVISNIVSLAAFVSEVSILVCNHRSLL